MNFQDTELTRKVLHVFTVLIQEKEGGLLFLQKYITPHIPELTQENIKDEKRIEEIFQHISDETLQTLMSQEAVGKGLSLTYNLLKNSLQKHKDEWKSIIKNKENTYIHEELEKLLQEETQQKEEKLAQIRKGLSL